MIVTIDGSAGSGKSTVARELAARLGIPYLDTGAMYRAVACAALQQGVDPGHAQALSALARGIKLELDCGPAHTRVRVDGHDVTDMIRAMAVSAATSQVARCPTVREILIEQQRRIGARLASFVSEGRDQGSVVFPNADQMFLLDASLEERAQRRFQELTTGGETTTIEAVVKDLRIRDRIDARHWQPLLETGCATLIDTTEMTIKEVVDRMMELLPARSTP